MDVHNKKQFIKFRQNIIFHFYRYHKDQLPQLRIWFVARHVVDESGAGWVRIGDLCKATKLTRPYLIRTMSQSPMTRKTTSERMYYQSADNILRLHRLGRDYHSGMIRVEKKTRRCKAQFATDKLFKAFITKCFVEDDLDDKFRKKITKGMIGYQTISHYFQISRDTAIKNIKRSEAKIVSNGFTLPQFRFKNKKEFHNWLLNNIHQTINGIRVEANLGSFHLAIDRRGGYCLRQILPNRYRFTGRSLIRAKLRGGKGKNLCIKSKKLRESMSN